MACGDTLGDSDTCPAAAGVRGGARNSPPWGGRLHPGPPQQQAAGLAAPTLRPTVPRGSCPHPRAAGGPRGHPTPLQLETLGPPACSHCRSPGKAAAAFPPTPDPWDPRAASPRPAGPAPPGGRGVVSPPWPLRHPPAPRWVSAPTDSTRAGTPWKAAEALQLIACQGSKQTPTGAAAGLNGGPGPPHGWGPS